jgi:hypothetical protein
MFCRGRGLHGDFSPRGDGDGKEMLPASIIGDGVGKFRPHRGGDGKSFPDGEFPIAIPSQFQGKLTGTLPDSDARVTCVKPANSACCVLGVRC